MHSWFRFLNVTNRLLNGFTNSRSLNSRSLFLFIFSTKGAFNNYVIQILPKFWPPPPRVDNCEHFTYLLSLDQDWNFYWPLLLVHVVIEWPPIIKYFLTDLSYWQNHARIISVARYFFSIKYSKSEYLYGSKNEIKLQKWFVVGNSEYVKELKPNYFKKLSSSSSILLT